MPDYRTPIYLSLPKGPAGWAESVTDAFNTQGFKVVTRADRERSLAWPQALQPQLSATEAMLTIIAPGGLDRWQRREQALLAQIPASAAAPQNLPQNLLVLPGNQALPAAFGFARPWLMLKDPRQLQQLPDQVARRLQQGADPTSPCSSQCPYPGLRSLTPSEGALLFGRHRALQRLAKLLTTTAFVVLSGAVGVGRRSLVRAGLFPLRSSPTGDGPWECISLRPGDAPFHALGHALLPLLQPDLDANQRDRAADDLGNQLQTGSVTLEVLLQQLLRVLQGCNGVLLHLHALETLATASDSDSARQFINMLIDAAASAPLQLVATLDSRFQGQLLQRLPMLPERCGWIALGAFSDTEAADVITGPARLAGLTVADKLLTAISTDAGSDGVHPTLLACALQQTWLRRDGATLSEAAYHAGGRLGQCLEQRANQTWAMLSQEQRQHARQLWEHQQQAPAPTDDVAGWSRTRRWQTQRAAFHAWRQSIDDALQAWQHADRAGDALLHGADQMEAEAWLQREGSRLQQDEREFIRAGQPTASRLRGPHRSRRRERVLLATLALTLLALVVSSSQWWLATQHSIRPPPPPPDTVATDTDSIPPTNDQQQSLPQASDNNNGVGAGSDISPGKLVTLLVPGHRPASLAFSSDGAFLLTGSSNGSINLWELASAESRQQLDSGNREIAALQFFDHDRQFFSVSSDSTVNTWRLPARHPTLLHPGSQQHLTVVAANRSGSRLLTADSSRNATVFDLIKGRQLQRLKGHRAEIIAAAFAPDDTRLASADEDGNIWLWDALSLSPLQQLRAHRSFVDNLRFSHDGQRLLSAGGDGHIRLWDSHNGQPLVDIRAADGRIHVARFSPSDTTLANSDDSGVIKLWDSATGDQVMTLSGHTGIVRGLAFSPDGRWLASVGDDRSVRLWELANGAMTILKRQHAVPLNGVWFGPRGRWLAVAGNSATLLLWPLRSRQQP